MLNPNISWTENYPTQAFLIYLGLACFLLLTALLLVSHNWPFGYQPWFSFSDSATMALSAVVGTAVVGAGAIVAVVIARAALSTAQQTDKVAQASYRLTNLNVDAARKWIIARRRVVSQLDFLLVNSKSLIDAINAPPGQVPTHDDVPKSLYAILDPLLRVRDAVAEYSANHALLLSTAIARKTLDPQSTNSGVFSFLDSWKQALKAYPDPILHHTDPVVGDGTRLSLSAQSGMHSIFKILAEIDYLARRADTFQAIGNPTPTPRPTTGPPTQLSLTIEKARVSPIHPRDQLEILRDNLRDILVHVAVLRAYLEAEWSLALCNLIDEKRSNEENSEAIENYIVELLSAADRTTFYSCIKPSVDSVPGYQFRMLTIMLGRALGSSSEEESSHGNDDADNSNMIKTRVDLLYDWSYEADRHA